MQEVDRKAKILLFLNEWKNDRMKNFRSWKEEFFSPKNFSIPKFSELKARLQMNIVYFQTNYMIISLLFILVGLYIKPILLIFLFSLFLLITTIQYFGNEIQILSCKITRPIYLSFYGGIQLFFND